ncbi:unnamed protein product [Brassica rapa]|uniref:Bulb-type lectin domain-containing protein n=2 Tax=Brassica TaxID=3705 RepID=A0A3P5ZQK6_BRACM|nr:unnamed protein product [Brassica napus]CAG7883371.1 unnamed protein product [Brassica rapa]VDC82567.1 unnamed protein product [Brassica rapa]
MYRLSLLNEHQYSPSPRWISQLSKRTGPIPAPKASFGFRKIQPNDGFTLSIWFDKIPDKTIVWHAQAVNTTTGLVPEGSKVTFAADRGLAITDPRGQQHWSSSLPPGSGSVSRGHITDAGNFRLLSKDSGEDLWSSFGHPTDTLLPTQGDGQRPKCQCPEKFLLMDPSDEYGDCKPDFEMQTCGPENNETENVHVNVYELMRVDRTNWPYGDYQRYSNFDEDKCRNACLNDCFCAAVVYGNDRVCWAKRFPLSFGQRAPNAKLLMMNQTHTLTNIRGTKGYVTPEWFRNSPITSKVDVYSYGVVLLEIVCCKKAVDLDESVILIDWAYDCFRDRRLEDLTENDLEAIEDVGTVERYVKIGIET